METNTADQVEAIIRERDEAVRAIDKAFKAIGPVEDWLATPREDLIANAIEAMRARHLESLREQRLTLGAENDEVRAKLARVQHDAGELIKSLQAERDELKEANELGFQTAHDERDKLVVEIIKLRTALERVKAGLCYPDEYRQVATEALATPQP